MVSRLWVAWYENLDFKICFIAIICLGYALGPGASQHYYPSAMPNYPYAKIQDQAISFSARAKTKIGGRGPLNNIRLTIIGRTS